MNNKMITNSQLSTAKLKRNENANKLNKHPEQEHYHRNGEYMEDYQQGVGGGEWGKKYRE